MDFTILVNQWCDLSPDAIIWIITDGVQNQIAEAIKRDVGNRCVIQLFSPAQTITSDVKLLMPKDLLLVLLTLDTFVTQGANRCFSPFGKPQGVSAKYAFVRLGITQHSLLQGLYTPKELVYEKINEMSRITSHDLLRITNQAGTDIILQVKPFTTCSHEITEDGGFAFFPPSEVTSEVIAKTASGKIVVDVTVGQFYYYGKLLGTFGRVPSPVTLIVGNGVVTDIYGNRMAEELKEKWFELPQECREVVELGQGLSQMSPTGLIGVDESIIDTCHFGIGDGGICGMHLDVVLYNPVITAGHSADSPRTGDESLTY